MLQAMFRVKLPIFEQLQLPPPKPGDPESVILGQSACRWPDVRQVSQTTLGAMRFCLSLLGSVDWPHANLLMRSTQRMRRQGEGGIGGTESRYRTGDLALSGCAQGQPVVCGVLTSCGKDVTA